MVDASPSKDASPHGYRHASWQSNSDRDDPHLWPYSHPENEFPAGYYTGTDLGFNLIYSQIQSNDPLAPINQTGYYCPMPPCPSPPVPSPYVEEEKHQEDLHHKNRGNPVNSVFQCRWHGCTYAGHFTRTYDLLRHIRLIHLNPRQYSCPINAHCKRFSRKDNLVSHMRRIHGQNL
ncbi:hypothetical protein BGW36DRAFT_377163 [Talaromyces proteolyticus]|uniref:C2H2-type domain-containing protein n=1 Tax=Talaromyces proteolyticus TaxID=1131652 RepID=A0AAD4Q1X9_9EURO|nr:uncharacterized protein BGW36DRAFT_377163 [Talaromyces proteolyticus]KAH8699028.1 hypothetical protein BGW36DRAFT_377163 [Talaromyces proteolyticus]